MVLGDMHGILEDSKVVSLRGEGRKLQHGSLGGPVC